MPPDAGATAFGMRRCHVEGNRILRKRVAGLYTIIAIKLVKGILLLFIALGIYSFFGEDLRAEFGRFLRRINIDPEHKPSIS